VFWRGRDGALGAWWRARVALHWKLARTVAIQMVLPVRHVVESGQGTLWRTRAHLRHRSDLVHRDADRNPRWLRHRRLHDGDLSDSPPCSDQHSNRIARSNTQHRLWNLGTVRLGSTAPTICAAMVDRRDRAVAHSWRAIPRAALRNWT